MIQSTTTPFLSLASVALMCLLALLRMLYLLAYVSQSSKLFHHYTTDLPTLIYSRVLLSLALVNGQSTLHLYSNEVYRYFYSSQFLTILTKAGKQWCGSTKIIPMLFLCDFGTWYTFFSLMNRCFSNRFA